MVLPFREIWYCDCEFSADGGNRPAVRCLVAREHYTGRVVRQWLDNCDAPAEPPFPIDHNVLFVAYFATAELGCFLALNWQLPVRVLDLYVEFKRHICGHDGQPGKPSLVHALDYFGLESIDASHKAAMRDLAIRGGPYTDDEREALLRYCKSDVDALPRLLVGMFPHLDLPRAVLRGEFMKVIAHVEHNGVPVDAFTLAQLDEHWEGIQEDLIYDVDADYGVYDGIHFREERFARWLVKVDIPWPRRTGGDLEINDDVFKDLSRCYPRLLPLQQLRSALDLLRLADLPVGRDSRNRTLLSPFGTITGRCAPSTSSYIFSRPAWMRSLIRPEEGRALAYVDWSSQEYGIGAVLSGDATMVADYTAGDPYLGFAKRIGMVPDDATKHSHRGERDLIKVVILGTQYGMGETSLAARIAKPVIYARDLLRAHRRTYRRFWEWSEAAVNTALFRGRIWTRYGWQTYARHKTPTAIERGDPNTRSLANFPCQANAADMLRLATSAIITAGVQLDALIHDAVLVEAGIEDIDHAVHCTENAMGRASELVLSGYRLRTDVEVIHYPNRYRDSRGWEFFQTMLRRLESRVDPGRFVQPDPGRNVRYPRRNVRPGKSLFSVSLDG